MDLSFCYAAAGKMVIHQLLRFPASVPVQSYGEPSRLELITEYL